MVPDELLRPAIELAFVALVAASKASPPVPIPPAVAPYKELFWKQFGGRPTG